MLKITKFLNNLDNANQSGDKEKYERALKDFAWKCWSLAGTGKLYTKNSKGEIVRVTDGKKVEL